MSFEPMQLEVQWARLINVVNEQAVALQRTSFTPVVRDSGDLSACVFDRRGYLLAQADTGTPGHINSMAQCMRYVLREFPPDQLEPGDVLITNDPWESSGHLHDISVITPIFLGRSLVGFFVNCCHAVDVGGRGFGADARELYEEGLYLPITKIYKAREPNVDLERIIRGNVREPDLVMGDIHAQVIANDVGGKRLLEMMDEFKMDDLVPLADEIIRRSEAAMREALGKVPPGTYHGEIWSDGFDEPVRLAVAVHIGQGEAHVDFTGTSPQSPWGINVVLNYTHAYTTYALKCAVSPDVPNNEGSFRPVRITAPEGCILNARRPSPVDARHVLGHFVPLVIHKALESAVPVLAEGAANTWAVQVLGAGRAEQEKFTAIFFTSGGMGASPKQDGLSVTGFPSGVRGIPVEIIEATSPLLVEQKELRTDSGGPGRHRGGLGQNMIVRALTERPFVLSAMFDRFSYPPLGVAGGGPGEPGGLEIDGQPMGPKGRLAIPAGGTFTLKLPGGAGWGDPRRRDPGQVAEDVRQGLVSPEAARREYGVAVDQEGRLNPDETKRLRG